jgi:hypothetical protein
MYTSYYSIKHLCSLLTIFIYVFFVFLTLSTDYFPHAVLADWSV